MYRDNKLDSTSIDICREKLEQLKTIFPEVFCKDEIDFDKLKLILGNSVVSEKERFGLNWSGKANCFKIIQNPTAATLRPCREQSIDFDTTQNLFIEGDNLEVLKLLQRSYSNKVKMIYIDPPYNTGKDFIYPDDYTENLDTYLRYTEQKDEEGRGFTTNTESDGRYHSKWLSMMYPRLYLAKSLLRDDGVIFISIDDHEQAYLKVLMDQIFGKENFFATLIRRAMHTVRNSSKDFNKHADFVLTYAKNKSWFESNPNNFIRQMIDKTDNYPLDDRDNRGPYKVDPLYARNYATPYIYTFKNGIVWQAPSGSYPRYSRDTLKRMEQENRIELSGKEPKAKRYLKEVQEGQPPNTILATEDVGYNMDGTSELHNILGIDKVFSQPKPIKLVKHLIRLLRDKNGLILDFFSGSATTAHAVMKLNAEDGGNRKYIMVQLPEKCSEDSEAYKAGYKTIADIGKERIRRAAKKILEEHSDYKGDLGFKVFKLDSSNFELWKNNTRSEEEYNKQLSLAVDNIKKDRSQEDILYEIILRLGLKLTDTIDLKSFGDKNVFSLEGGKILVCLEKIITKQLIEELIKYNPDKVIFLDIGFQGNDLLKIYAQDSFKNHISDNKNKAIEFIVY